MAPYRSVDRDPVAEATRDHGIVGDVIAQFADPLAFYRELIQNALDAGSASVDVAVTYEAGHVRVTVRDRGCGMTRDIIENQLLVLFRSTKEKDPTKIGKFGIGFASVLSPSPAIVIVHSVRDGQRLTLHLRPDLTYELFDGGRATQHGTTVELELRRPKNKAADFARASYQALVRWCRHASVPIKFTADVPGLGAPLALRVDRPLGLDEPLVELTATAPDGKLIVVAGLERREGAYTGFFNHGLMLYETSEPLLGGLVSCKLQDARLGHTLSRDNVRRDDHFAHALTFARELVHGRLGTVAGQALRAAAESGHLTLHRELAHAIVRAGLRLSEHAWWIPLVVPVGSLRTMALGAIPGPLWYADGPSRVATAFAKAGIPVARFETHEVSWLAKHLPGRAPKRLSARFVHVRPVTPTEHELALVAHLAAHLAACRRAPDRIELAELEDAGAPFVIGGGIEHAHVGDAEGGGYVLEHDVTKTTPIGRFGRGTLVLSAEHPTVKAARAHHDPRSAAALLARAVLLHYGMLDSKRSATLLARSLTALGIEAAP